MKKTLIYGLSAALLLVVVLAACHRPQADRPAEPQEPDPAVSTSAPADVSTPEPEKPAAPEPTADTVPEPEPEQTPATPAENEDTQQPEPATTPEPQKITAPEPPAKQTPPAPVEPEEAQPTEGSQQAQQSSGSTQKIDGHDDLGDYVLNGQGGKYYPALGITLPVSYDGKTHEGTDFSQSPDYKVGIDTAEEHTESWSGVNGG